MWMIEAEKRVEKTTKPWSGAVILLLNKKEILLGAFLYVV